MEKFLLYFYIDKLILFNINQDAFLNILYFLIQNFKYQSLHEDLSVYFTLFENIYILINTKQTTLLLIRLDVISHLKKFDRRRIENLQGCDHE